MLKKFLKSSVSALVLMGMTTTLTPSYAGSSSSKNAEPEDKKPSILFKRPNLALKELKQPQGSNGLILKGQEIPADVLVNVFTFFDHKSVLNVERTCKNWRWIVNKGQTDFRKIWKDQGNPEHLPPFITHPLNILWILEQLTPRFPTSCSHLGETPSEGILPSDIMDQFAYALNQHPENAPFLIQNFTHIDPLDIQEVGLAAYISKSSEEIQKDLKHIAGDLINTMVTKDNLKFVKDHKNIPSLQKQLMALKLLALCGDQDAHKKLTFMGNLLHLSMYKDHDIKKTCSFIGNTPSLVNTVNKFSLAFYTDYKAILEDENFTDFWLKQYRAAPNSNSNLLKKIRSYYFTLFPDLQREIFGEEEDYAY